MALATRPPNQASSEGQVPARKVKGKHKSKAPDRTADVPGRYSWGGGAKRHSIPERLHNDRVIAQQQLGTNDLTAPPTGAQAIREANAAADLQYGPQVTAAQQANANVAPWFQQYMARVAGEATAAQQRMQPILDQAGKLADPTTAAQTQAAPELDPNSEAGRASAMAAQGRAALAALGQQALQTNATSTQDTLAGMGTLAAREQPQAQAYAGQQIANAQSQRGQAVTGFLTTARQNAQNYQIARGTLGANIANQQADNATQAAGLEQSAKDKRAARGVTKRGQDISQQNTRDRLAAQQSKPNKYGIPEGQWETWSASHRQRVIDKARGSGTSPSKAKQFEDRYGVKPVSTVTANNARDDIEEARSTVRRVVKSNPKMTREQLGDLLLHGQGETKDSAGVRKVKALWASVVLDLQFNNGMVSRKTADRLHQAGYSAKQLGLPTQATPAKNPPPKPELNTGGNLGGFPH